MFLHIHDFCHTSYLHTFITYVGMPELSRCGVASDSDITSSCDLEHLLIRDAKVAIGKKVKRHVLCNMFFMLLDQARSDYTW